jgi:hypothetical protein
VNGVILRDAQPLVLRIALAELFDDALDVGVVEGRRPR